MIKANSYHPSFALGGIFLSLFGAMWLFGASYQFAGASLSMVSAIAIGSLLISGWAVATFRARRREFSGGGNTVAGKRVRRGLLVINMVQWSSIGIAILLLSLTEHAAWIMPTVILIVGVHFFPLAQLFAYRGYYLTAVALVLVALLYMLFGGQGHSAALALLATGATLWGSAIALLRAM